MPCQEARCQDIDIKQEKAHSSIIILLGTAILLRVPKAIRSFMRHKGNVWVSSNSQTYTWLFHTLFYIVKRHSYPIVTTESYVWRECGPDYDEVLHSTLFQAMTKI